MNRKHVLVLGNGPVGQTTALLLANWGISVTIVDSREQRDSIGSKAIAQQRDVLDVWEHLGVGSRVAAEGTTWSRSRTYYKSSELFCDTYYPDADSPFPAFVNLSQTRTEQLLDERIAQQPLIQTVWDQNVEDIEQGDTGVTVYARSRDGTEISYTGEYAVAALGARADDFRKILGLTLEGKTFDDRFLICDITSDAKELAGERRFHFDPAWNPGRQVLIHPCPGSQYRIDWQVPADFDLAEEEENGGLERRIRQIIGDSSYEIVWKSVYRFHSRVVQSMRVGRVLLAGDVAHLISPFGGRGLNSGIGDAENAAWKLAYVLHGWANESLLDSYDRERRAAAIENIAVTSHTMDFLVPQNKAQQELREQLLEQALSDPNAKSKIDSGRLFEPFWYVDSPLTTLSDLRPFKGRPLKGQSPRPGPGVILPDAAVTVNGRDTQVRRLARDGILLLTGKAVDLEALAPTAEKAVSGPVTALRIADIDHSESLTARLQAAPHDVWVIRPDAYVAAVGDVRDPDSLIAALSCSLGTTSESGLGEHATAAPVLNSM